MGGRAHYRAAGADTSAWARPRRPKPCRLAQSPALRTLVALKLARNWSPQQIAGWFRETFPDDPCLHVSHETIYRSLFVQSRGVLKRELVAHLRRRHAIRRPQGARHSYIATLVERQSRFVLLVRLASKDTLTVVAALTRAVRTLPDGLMASLTWDRGTELAAHKAFTMATHVQVYFCDPQSPWQRGTNENTNGLLRQYFPKGMDLSPYTQADLDDVALQLNTRPRKTLGYATPADRQWRPLLHRPVEPALPDDDQHPAEPGHGQHRPASVAAIHDGGCLPRHHKTQQETRKEQQCQPDLVGPEAPDETQRRERQGRSDQEKTGQGAAQPVPTSVLIDQGDRRTSDGRDRAHDPRESPSAEQHRTDRPETQPRHADAHPQ